MICWRTFGRQRHLDLISAAREAFLDSRVVGRRSQGRVNADAVYAGTVVTF